MSASLQRDEAWLQQATANEVVTALAAGELVEISTRTPPMPGPVPAPEGQIAEGALNAMAPGEIVEALNAGQLDFLLGRTTAAH